MNAVPKKDLIIAPLCEAALIFIVAGAGFLLHKPLIFTSLGPTAYELIETPERKSARPYNVVVGHLIGMLSGFAGLLVLHATSAPGLSSGTVTVPRMGAAAIATGLTVLVTLAVKATQPAALSTSLIVALGQLQQPRDVFVIMGAVLLMEIFGEPLRRWRLRDRHQDKRRIFEQAA